MTYEWENEIRKMIDELDDALFDAEAMLPDGCVIIGVSVANMDTGEATTIRIDETTGVLRADLWGDAAGDAMNEYNDAVLHLFRKKPVTTH